MTEDEVHLLWLTAVKLRQEANTLQKQADQAFAVSEQAWQNYLTTAAGWRR